VQNKKGLTPKICTSTIQGTTKVQINTKQTAIKTKQTYICKH